jgi:hypothetical protein
MWDAEYFVKVDDDVHVNIGEYILLPETFSWFSFLPLINSYNNYTLWQSLTFHYSFTIRWKLPVTTKVYHYLFIIKMLLLKLTHILPDSASLVLFDITKFQLYCSNSWKHTG